MTKHQNLSRSHLRLRSALLLLAICATLVVLPSPTLVAQTTSTTEQPTTEQPVTGQPVTEQPVTGQPATGQPVTGQPVAEQPATGQPVTGQPTTEQPTTEQPTSEQPTTEQPTTEQPVTGQPVTGQPVTDQLAKAHPQERDASTEALQFSFERTPWRDVIRWVADECDLALQYEELPTGSMSYSDSREYSQTEAIDRVNLFLLPQGYTLVRSGRLLSLINLADPRSLQQLDALADLVTPLELDERHGHEVVKCLFPLGELEAQEAVEELSPIKLLKPPAVFSKTKQLLVTDTVTKLKNVRAILAAFGTKGTNVGTVMKTFHLEHVHAEDILLVARPHLGLGTDEMIGIDISLSSDLNGENIFATGVEDRVKLVEDLVTALDQRVANVAVTGSEAVLKSHVVGGGNVQTIYSVLQTMLAGRSMRLSMDEKAGTIVALAAPKDQEEIAQTVAQLQATDAEFEVIALNSVDPYYAIGLIEEMLDLNSSTSAKNSAGTTAPKIDADPGNRRLFVRGKRHQIDQIKKIVAGLEGQSSTPIADKDDVRVLPLKGKQAERLLETAVKFWRRPNPILLFPATEDEEPQVIERVLSDQRDTRLIMASWNSKGSNESLASRYLTETTRSQAPVIRCQATPRGLLLQSDDAVALDQFEAHLRAIHGPTEMEVSPPVVFYLEFVRPDDSLRMLAELLDGGESAKEGQAGTLINGSTSSPTSFVSSIVTSRDGTATMISGTTTIVADSRLNRLIAQGVPADIERIEGYLKIIDKDKSLADNKTNGTSHIIELIHTPAAEAATMIRDAYGSRVTGGSIPAPPTPTGAASPVRDPAAVKEGEVAKVSDEKKTPSKNAANQPVQDLTPTMTVAVHEPSNSLVVTAPTQLFKEVEQLVKLIDARNEKTVEIVSTENLTMLKAYFQPEEATDSSRGGSTSSNKSTSSNSSRTRFLNSLKSKSTR